MSGSNTSIREWQGYDIGHTSHARHNFSHNIVSTGHVCIEQELCSTASRTPGHCPQNYCIYPPVPSPPSPPPAPFDQNQAPTSFKTPTSPHRIFDLQDSLELMHFPPQPSHFVPLRNGFYSFRAQTDQHHPVDPDSYTAVARGVVDIYP